MSEEQRSIDERIATLERWFDHSSPAPWWVYSEPEVGMPPTIVKTVDGGGVDIIEPLSYADKATTVECRNAAPILIDEIRRLRAENERLQSELGQSVKLKFVGRAKPMPFHDADEDQ